MVQTPEYYFKIWFLEPLKVLKSIKGSNGGFIALATCCYLYERYARAKLIETNLKADDNNLVNQLAKDFLIDDETANIFWDVIRNGLLHQAMPKIKDRDNTLVHWVFHRDLRRPFDVITKNNKSILRVHPWRFMEKVLDLCTSNFELMKKSRSFPLGVTVPIHPNSDLLK